MRDAIRAFALAALALLTASAQPAVADTMTLAYVGHPAVPKANPLPLDEPAPDEGVAGARLGIVDDNGTGRFTAQEFVLKQTIVPADASVLGAVKSLPPDVRFVITDLSANELAEVARAFPQLTFLNASAPDDALRREHCAVNVLHTIPSRAMLTDALAQYLALKKWSKWLLVVGPEPADKLYADAVKRSAQKFGAQIVAEKPGPFRPQTRTPIPATPRCKRKFRPSPAAAITTWWWSRMTPAFRRRTDRPHRSPEAYRRHAGIGPDRMESHQRAMGGTAAAGPLL